MAALIDTSVAILLRDVDSRADEQLVRLDAVPALSIVSRVELENGVVANPAFAMQRRAALDKLLTTFQVLDFDAACADAYRQIVEAAGYSRRKVADRMIAATALTHGLVLVTANAGDFEDVPGLTLDIW